jgi:hypothetical protein
MTVLRRFSSAQPTEMPPSAVTPRSAEDLAAKETGYALSPGFMGANLFTDDKLRQVSATPLSA